MDNLSDQLILRILNYVSFKDLLNLKQLNKKFYSLIDTIIIDQLIITHHRMPLNERWFNTNELINYGCLLKTKDYCFIKLDYSIFRNLKKLFIISTDYSNTIKFNLVNLFQQINKFINLEQLQLNGIKMELTNQIEINLAKLKILSIERIETGFMFINTPELENLCLNFNTKSTIKSIDYTIKFKYPNSIKNLIAKKFENYIIEFINLEYLFLEEPLSYKELKDIENNCYLLIKLSKLNEIIFYENLMTFDYLLEQKSRLKRDNFKISYCGLNLNSIDDLELLKEIYTDQSPYFVFNSKIIKYLIDNNYFNYKKFTFKQPFITKLIYNDLDELIDRIPNDLFNRLINLKSIQVTKEINDVNKFIKLLNLIPNLRSLILKYTLLNSSFFDKLPKLQPILDEIVIYTQEDLDYEFLLEFNQLNHILIDQNIDHNLIYELFLKFNELEFSFYYEDIKIRIDVCDDKFKLFIDKKETIEFEDLNKLFKHFVTINFLEDEEMIISDYSLQDDLEDEEFDNEDIFL